jgi:predicted transcriptional regulator
MPRREIVGAVIALIAEDRDDFDAETIRGVIDSAYELFYDEKSLAEKLESSRNTMEKTLEEFVAEGFIQKNGDKYLVTQDGRKVFRQMWIDIGAYMEVRLAGGYVYYKAKKQGGLI